MSWSNKLLFFSSLVVVLIFSASSLVGATSFPWPMFMPAIQNHSQQEPINIPFPSAPWQTYGCNPQHNNLSFYAGVIPSPSTLNWFSSASSLLQSYDTHMAIDNQNTIYIRGYDSGYVKKVLRAVNHLTGETKWTYRAKNLWNNKTNVEGTPTIGTNGYIYVCDSDYSLHAVNKTTGNMVWRTGFSHLYSGCPITIGIGGIIYLATDGLIAVDPNNGTFKWSYIPDWMYQPGDVKVEHIPPAVGPDGSVYVVIENNGYSSGGLVSLSSDGKFNWKFSTEVTPLLSPTIGLDGTIYLATYHNFYALNKNGTVKWTVPHDGYYSIELVSLLNDGTVYIFEGNTLKAYSGSSGNVKWEYNVGASLTAPFIPVDSKGILYLGTEDNLIGINSSGNQVWNYYSPNFNFGAPVIGTDGSLYLLTSYKLISFQP